MTGKNEPEDDGVRKVGYTLPIGPQHPMYVESENITLRVDGETIIGVDVNVGYMHRGIEELMQRRNYIQNIFLAERICGICSGIHTVTYCMAVEGLAGIEIPERAKHIRTIILELERLHSHFLFFGVLAYELGLESAFMYTWRDREHILDILELISGNRVNYGIPTIGGVRRDVPESKIPDILKKLDIIEEKGRHYLKVFGRDMLIHKRTTGKAILRKKDVNRLSLVGPVARASGVKKDVRKDLPYLAYDEAEWDVITEKEGDIRARLLVKLYEVFESVKILRYCFSKISKTPKQLKVKAPLVISPNEAIAVTEAPRGELIYYGISNGSDKPERMRIRTPSFTNIVNALPVILNNHQLGDMPVIVASLDPCFSCCDRVALVDSKTSQCCVVDEAYLKKLAEKEDRS